MDIRIFIHKKASYDLLSQKYNYEISCLGLELMMKVSIIYDLFGIEEADIERAIQKVFCNPITDIVSIEKTVSKKHFAIEYLPGVFDQKADSAEQCLMMAGIEGVEVRTGLLFEFESVSTSDYDEIVHLLVNPCESRIKDLEKLQLDHHAICLDVPIVKGFISMDRNDLDILFHKFGFSFSIEDLQWIQDYFAKLGRDPYQTELKILDTYWSDHCRHTTFETSIAHIDWQSPYNDLINKSYDQYIQLRKVLGINKPIRLMDLATITAKDLIKRGILDNIDISEEINACSIEVPIVVNGKKEPYLIMFKNETHNHPTEIEPYGGASTCIGGAIRDPLSGRAFVYQAVRISGAANPLENVHNTLAGKLSQRQICQKAAQGFSDYGNQMGVATTLVKEYYHTGYKAKRMEVGFVLGAVKKSNIRREAPLPGDKIILLGGRTGRDGIGGATGSSKTQLADNVRELSAEVQKGNALIERNIQRLFRKPKVIALIKKCNDFGAGGVAVAIGELADGIIVNLDLLPTKYSGLNGTELSISESQERMAVVVSALDTEQFITLANRENLEATVVAEVTQEDKVEFVWRGEKIVQLDRKFIATNGKLKNTNAIIGDGANLSHVFAPKSWNLEAWELSLASLQNTSQVGLIELFDSNVCRSTILSPMGGMYQLSTEDVSVQKILAQGNHNQVSIVSYGLEPLIFEKSTYHGAYYAVVESISKVMAAGGGLSDIRLSFQEYFERLTTDQKWGKALAALLGAFQAQQDYAIAAIGGKDSMSGSYRDIHVPPTLISFAVCPSEIEMVRCATLQSRNSLIYVFAPDLDHNQMLDAQTVIAIHRELQIHHWADILCAKVVGSGGIAVTLSQMAMGNQIAWDVETQLNALQIFVGAVIYETKQEIQLSSQYQKYWHCIGKTNSTKLWKFNGITINKTKGTQLNLNTLSDIYPFSTILPIEDLELQNTKTQDISQQNSVCVKVVIPVFAGTNSEYDTTSAFEQEGANVTQVLIRSWKSRWLIESISMFVREVQNANILCFVGGFSSADEPDGSGKFIANFIKNIEVTQAIHDFLDRGGLILGICNGFQALVASGLLPHGRVTDLSHNSPYLLKNSLSKHISKLVRVKVNSDKSPWLKGMLGQQYWIPISHGEGRMVNTQDIPERQIGTVYTDIEGNIGDGLLYNPNGSDRSIEGLISPCGKIFGRMGHPERVFGKSFINVPDVKQMNIFACGVRHFVDGK